MLKNLILFFILAPLSCLAQSVISGKILSKVDNKPVANASVFLSNATIGSKTTDEGTFTLSNVKPGKYDLVVSIVGFEGYNQTIIVGNSDIKLPDITLSPKSNVLKEVTIKVKHDPYRSRNFDWFKEDFLGTSYLARECTILNPDKLDLDYDDTTGILTASSYDFLVIENPELGYRIKYQLDDFISHLKDSTAKKIFYKGSVIYEEMKGSASAEKRWRKNRQEVYETSSMHFFRAAAANRLTDEGFRVMRVIPDRPSDSLINTRISQYKILSETDSKLKDSLSYWVKKSRIPKTQFTIIRTPLKHGEFVQQANQSGLYNLMCNYGALYITYNKAHKFSTKDKLEYLNDPRNTENSMVNFNTPTAPFYKNGVIADPYSVLYNGAWGRYRMADLLPVDYEPQSEGNPADSTVADKIAAKLTAFSEQHVSEKSYLHLDKPYYAAGDTVYFKAYVISVQDHQLTNQSGILNVDLINTTNQIDRSIKLQLVDGVSWGDFALPDSLPKGNYRIRAYTNLMRNDGNDTWFDQVIPAGSNHVSKVAESSSKNAALINTKADVQFFPEGGQMVTGIQSKLAFKAIGSDGKGVEVKGVILDNQDKEVTTFASAHLGMGYFNLTQQEGKSYKAKLTYADGTTGTADIPKAVDKGIVLSINNDSIPKATVKIEASKAGFEENKNKDFTLVIYSGGIATTVTCNLNNPVISLDILKRQLHSGVTTVTLFSPTGEPLCERLIFVQKYDQLNLAVNGSKSTYGKREKANFKLDVKTRANEPSAGQFSVSVVDEGKVPVNEDMESTINSYLLLKSDLKGYIEEPNYYFNEISDKKLADLDLVMLTHGYRRFEWKKLLNKSYPPAIYKPENAFEISGTATTMMGKPLSKGIISLIKMKDGSFIRDTTDDKGHYRFSNLLFPDSTRFMLQAVGAKGKSNTKLSYNKEPQEPVLPNTVWSNGDVNQLMTAYMQNYQKQRDEIAQYGTLNGRMLRDVTIKGTRRTDDAPISATTMVTPGFATSVIKPDQMLKGGPFSERIRVALHGIIVRPDTIHHEPKAYLHNGGNPMRLILDGNDILGGDLDAINGDMVESVEVMKFNSTIGAYGGFQALHTDGVLVIHSKKGGGVQADWIASIGVLPVIPKGFYKVREFYSPKYDHQDSATGRPDLRTTIFWKPNLVTGKDGSASFDFYNADGPANYRIVVEGIDEKGNIGRLVYRYKVQ